ncbi:type II toxin-antitoxin system RelE/ParE family toxin [Reyranella sp. CPCC 100927]|uniref:type II toxin-antitoxin system RelE/ParE family toxin n=1 Tax=Reyranella sp. CPCC 100927 TaxID=2599616 RepID=UPI0011B81BAB|nr:type II toxin-antitoxin system RelE/ParE family toxin [Reyranella sp. CPCC 100927]TWT09507.1 type II toxin-antitoxin system RelE/ParE family toxin [Reyranella sp. CPCC 100927]
MPRELIYRPLAEEDLQDIYLYIAADNPQRAFDFVSDIRSRCVLLCDTPALGPSRPRLGAGLRIYPIRRRVVVIYRVLETAIEVVRVFYGGRDIETLLADSE